jgi:hypothetical protein
MAKHFDFGKAFNAQDDKHRPLLMQVMLKCGDGSNVCRPFEPADKWCDVLCEEFFRQGDLEMANGMEHTSPLNDREHLDKPLSVAAARALPPLQANVDRVQSTLATRKAAAAKATQNMQTNR